MKNIFVLPTDKPSTPSRLFYKDQELVFSKKYSVFNGVNIYITSDVEDINENDYIITKDGKLVQVSYLLSKDLEGASKVILTTDQYLIKDGVQAIDDEFLEWFIKNPSCESVEVKKGFADGTAWGYNFLDYKIIIPKEEPKQENRIDTCYNFNKEIGCVQAECRCEKEETVQETPEEEYLNKLIEEANKEFTLDGKLAKEVAIKYANYQAERMYSEEEVLNIIADCDGSVAQAKKWFEQFKKK
jgi:hypothetical protein